MVPVYTGRASLLDFVRVETYRNGLMARHAFSQLNFILARLKQMSIIYLHLLIGGHTGPFTLRDPAILRRSLQPCFPASQQVPKACLRGRKKICQGKLWVFILRAPQSQPAVIRGCQGTTGGQTYSRIHAQALKATPPQWKPQGPQGRILCAWLAVRHRGLGKLGSTPKRREFEA